MSQRPFQNFSSVFIYRFSISQALLLIAISILPARFPIAINSGNPNFPFPQFLPYTTPDGVYPGLETNNGAGVPHAELEEIIRDAYQVMMNRCEYPGDGVGSVKYIRFKSDPQVSEGDGYAMLAAAYMADKQTFDGLWLWVHDYRLQKAVNYRTGQVNNPTYKYSPLPGWIGTEFKGNSAADADFDIALALHVAFMQWGEFMGINDANGNPISYKHDLVKFLKALSDTLTFSSNGNLLSGDIGIDGYIKGGDSWPELTDWSRTQTILPKTIETVGPTMVYIDYAAPSYFHAFAQFLREEDSDKYAWNIYQFERAEASSDWLMGEHYRQDIKNIPNVGQLYQDGDHTTFDFRNDKPAEDLRFAWRTILNELWHGSPKTTWNPETHQVVPGGNSFEKDMALRFAKFLQSPQEPPWNNPCDQFGKFMPYWGIAAMRNEWNKDGTDGRWFQINWIHGTGSPSLVIAGDVDLLAENFRQLELKFDATTSTRVYLDKVPFYFHGWFRLLGMQVSTGNHHSPLNMKPSANMKVYLDVDKTFAFERDVLTYDISYRNFGSLDAQNVVISDTLHNDFVFVSATDGGTFDPGTRMVVWNIGTVPGFKTQTGIEPTQGAVQLKVKINEATQDRYANKAVINCSNGFGWISGDYPNNITSVMERNLVDIARRALVIKNKIDQAVIRPGEEVNITIDFENTTKAGWINGGRPGIHYAYGHDGTPPTAAEHKMYFQLFHDADESYIDLGNYRLSYFLNDDSITCLQGPDCNPGWNLRADVVEGFQGRNEITFKHESIVPGEDQRGKWNQRVIIQTSNPEDPNREPSLIMTSHQLEVYRGSLIAMHKGGEAPLRIFLVLTNEMWKNVQWNDDWSWAVNAKVTDEEKNLFWPVTNDWTDIYNPNRTVTSWHPKSCVEAEHTVDNVLVEEWDGYTWRRVAGNGPLPGRDAFNVVITDTIPDGLTFVEFTSPPPLGISPQINGNVITWKIPRMQIAQAGTLSYKARADGSCPMDYKQVIPRAWIQADLESPISSAAILTVSCSDLPAAAPPVANPPGDTFYDLQMAVSLTTATPGGAIYYTVDGSTPVPGQPDTKTFTAGVPIIITDTTVLTAVTILAGYEPSSLMIENYYPAELVPTDSVKTPTATSQLNTTQSPYTNTIRLSTETLGATILYTLDGTLPDPVSMIGTFTYDDANPIIITTLTTINAIAVKRGMFQSPLMSTKFSVVQKVETPVASPFASPKYIIPEGGPNILPVTLATATPNATIFYTLDGSVPDTLEQGTTKRYTGPITISSNVTIKAVGVLADWMSSDIRTAEYEFINLVATPRATPFQGPVHRFESTNPTEGSLSVELTVATDSATILYTLDGTDPGLAVGGSTIAYTGTPIIITGTQTIKAVAVRANWQPSPVLTAPYEKVLVLPDVTQAWIADGDQDGHAETAFIRFAEPAHILPDSVRIVWPEGDAVSKLGLKDVNIYYANQNKTVITVDFSQDPYPFGITGKNRQNPPYALLSDGQKQDLEDKVGAIITSAEIVQASYRKFRFEDDPTMTIHTNPDTLVIGLSEPLIALDPNMADKNRFLMVRVGCTDSTTTPLVLDALSGLTGSTEFDKLHIPLQASGTNKQVGYGDCIFLNPTSGYTDFWGTRSTELEQKVVGIVSEHRNFKSTLVRSVVGGGDFIREFELPKLEEVVIISSTGEFLGTESDSPIKLWIPPRYMTGDGTFDKNAQDVCTPLPAPIPRPMPNNCISTIAVISEGKYRADIKIFDHLGKFVHQSVQYFGYCDDELNNESRKLTDGFLSFLVWDTKDTEGNFVANGVYIWHVNYSFRNGRRHRTNVYKQGIIRGEPPTAGCALF